MKSGHICLSTFLFVLTVSGAQARDPLANQIYECSSGYTDSAKTQYADSVKACTLVIQSGRWKGSNVTWAYQNRGLTYWARRQFDAAIADFNKAISLKPGDAKSFLYRGAVYDDLRRYEEAIADFNRTQAIDPKNGDVYRDRAIAEQNSGQFDEALRDWKRGGFSSKDEPVAAARAHQPTTYKAWRELDLVPATSPDVAVSSPPVTQAGDRALLNDGKIRIVQGDLNQIYDKTANESFSGKDYKNAVHFFGLALQVNPSDVFALQRRAEAYLRMDKSDLALADANRAMKISPSADLFFVRGTAYLNLGKYRAALSDLNRAVAGDPKDAAAYFQRATAKYYLGDTTGYQADGKRAHQLDSAFPAP